MLSFTHTYLAMGLLFLLVWVVLFWMRPDLRRAMISISALGLVFGPLGDLIYTKDWWRPQTLSGDLVSFESALAGFAIAGVAAVIYEVLFRKKLKSIPSSKKTNSLQHTLTIWLLIVGMAFNYFAFFVLGFNSFIITILFFIVLGSIISYKRHDLIREAIASGVLLLLVAAMIYTVLELLTPGWIEAFWVFKNVPPVIIYNLPIDDIIFYSLAGFFLGPLYAFWQNLKTVQYKST